MLRTQIVLILAVVSLAACEKAKMKTVNEGNGGTAAYTAPVADPADDQAYEDQTPVNVDTTETVKTEQMTPDGPPVKPGEVMGEDGELNTDGEIKNVPIPTPRPAHEVSVPTKNTTTRTTTHTRVTTSKQDCPPTPAPKPRVREERVVQEQQVQEQQAPVQAFEIDSSRDLHCRWEPNGKPSTYLRFRPSTGTVWIQYGWPQQWAQYNGVTVVSGLPPFGVSGLTLVTRAGMSIASLRATSGALSATLGSDHLTQYPYEARFGEGEGRPARPTTGVCWSKEEPTVRRDNGGHH